MEYREVEFDYHVPIELSPDWVSSIDILGCAYECECYWAGRYTVNVVRVRIRDGKITDVYLDGRPSYRWHFRSIAESYETDHAMLLLEVKMQESAHECAEQVFGRIDS